MCKNLKLALESNQPITSSRFSFVGLIEMQVRYEDQG
jgi:hypothetical protein